MDKRQGALTFLQHHSVGTLATVSINGQPRSRTVYYASDTDFAVYVMTFATTRKVDDVEHDARAAFVVSDEDAPKTLQLEGTLTELTDRATIDPVTSALIKKTQERGPFFAPLAHLNPSSVKLYKLTPTWIRWGDFADGFGADQSFTEITG